MYACLICLVLYGTNKILRAIVLLFCSNFSQSFDCDGNSIPYHVPFGTFYCAKLKKKKKKKIEWIHSYEVPYEQNDSPPPPEKSLL